MCPNDQSGQEQQSITTDHHDARLSQVEHDDLVECEAVIQRGQQTFLEVGCALRTIRNQRLYRESHSSFESYLEDRWSMQRATAYRLIGAASVVESLSPIGDSGTRVPTTESQARPLVGLAPERQREVWTRAIEASQGAQPTAAQVKTLVASLKVVAPGAVQQAAKEMRAEREETRRQERMRTLATADENSVPLSTVQRRYPVLLADPAWRFERKISESRDIESHYPTMATEEIAALPVGDVAGEDAALFLWTTSSHLTEAFLVLVAWGFLYRTHAVWLKESMGQGHYFRQQHELLILATRGSVPTPSPSSRPSSVIVAPRGQHSEKPERVYEIIEAMYPGLPKLELFARRRRSGWDAWGNQVGILVSEANASPESGR